MDSKILTKILGHVDELNTVYNFAICSKLFNEVAGENELWANRFFPKFLSIKINNFESSGDLDWKDVFKKVKNSLLKSEWKNFFCYFSSKKKKFIFSKKLFPKLTTFKSWSSLMTSKPKNARRFTLFMKDSFLEDTSLLTFKRQFNSLR